ncbi:MAG: sulfotransferase [Rivularia sp. (in: cyanobacteria)]
MIMPNFIIIGAAKSGTTSLFYYLRQHPEIYMPTNKETNFFAFENENLNFCGPGDDIDTNKFSITNIKDYQQLFQGVTKEVAIGEASPLYIYSPKAPRLIKQYIPNTKLIAILRHPVERAYSNFLHFAKSGREPIADFEQALQEEENRIQDNWQWFWHYTRVGFYYEQLKRYFDIFDEKQIQVYLYEDFETNPLQVLQNIFQFLEVDETFTPDISTRHNTSGIYRNKFLYALLYRLFTKPNLIKAIAKPFLSYELRLKFTNNFISLNQKKPPMPSHVRGKLLEVYREDILKLQNLIDRDLSHWLKS